MSGQGIVRSGNCPVGGIVQSGNCPVGEMSGQGIVRSGNCPVGELSGRRIVWSENCPVEELSSRGIVCQEIVLSGNCPDIMLMSSTESRSSIVSNSAVDSPF